MPFPADPVFYPDASQQYLRFREQVFPSTLAENRPSNSEASPESELEMQARWFAGEFGRHFVSTDGKKVEIVQFGHWNHSAGPDFTEVAIKVDGRKLTGSLEVELEARSWESHHHATNPDFENVVLHVFLAYPQQADRFFTRSAEHREITQVALDWIGLDDWGPRPWNHLPEARLGRCANPLRDMAADKLNSLVTAAAQYRLQKKTRRLVASAEIHGPDEALFQAFAEALGFRHNKLAMRVLAQRLPLKSLLKHKNIEREARLFGAAGYIELDYFEKSQDEQTRLYLKQLWHCWWQIQDQFKNNAERQLNWHLSGVRPLNHPQRRLGALTAIMNTWPELLKIIQVCEQNPEAGLKKLKAYFTSLEHPFWNHHYTLRSKSSEKTMALVGRDRLQDILGNVLFPWLMREQNHCWQPYTQVPGSQMNEKLRRALLRLFGTGEGASKIAKQSSRNYFQQQALLQIYSDFCLVDSSECADCPFPEQLSQW